MSGLTSSGVSVEGRGPQLRVELREVERDLEDARERVRLADRATWAQVSYSRSGEAGRTVAILTVIQAVKRKSQKEVRALQQRQQQLLKDIDLAQRWAEHREQEAKREEQRRADRRAVLESARERQGERDGETREAREDERQRVERSRQRVKVEERRRGLSRDDEDHEPEIGF